MKILTKLFMRGLLTLLPISLSVYVLFAFFNWAESSSQNLLLLMFPNIHYVTGMGIGFGILVILALGTVMSSKIMKQLFSAIEMPFKNVPIIKSIYSAIQDLTQFFSPSEGKPKNKVVVVKNPNQGFEIIGFLTNENLSSLPDKIDKAGKVAVYVPMSYQIGGFTAFFPTEWVEEIDMSVEVAMRSALTAWMPVNIDED